MSLASHAFGKNGLTSQLRLVDSVFDGFVTLTFKGLKVRVGIVEVTPEIAERWITLNVRNRPLGESAVKRYAAIMASRKWCFNGETVVFDEEGNLINGQHRLHACLKSGKNFVTLVVQGISRKAFPTFDRPKIRNTADALALEGNTNCVQHAAALGHLYRHLYSSHTNVAPIEPSVLSELNRQHPEFVESVREGRRLHRLISTPIPAVCHYLFTKQDPDRAGQFFDGVREGVNLKSTSPMLNLRNWLINQRAAQGRVPAVVVLAVFFKAWRSYREGKPMKNLGWRYKGENPESFPSID